MPEAFLNHPAFPPLIPPLGMCYHQDIHLKSVMGETKFENLHKDVPLLFKTLEKLKLTFAAL